MVPLSHTSPHSQGQTLLTGAHGDRQSQTLPSTPSLSLLSSSPAWVAESEVTQEQPTGLPTSPGPTFLPLSCPHSCHGNGCLGKGLLGMGQGPEAGPPCSRHGDDRLDNQGERHLPGAQRTHQAWTAGQTGTHLDGTTPLGGRRKHRREETSLSGQRPPMPSQEASTSHCTPQVE